MINYVSPLIFVALFLIGAGVAFQLQVSVTLADLLDHVGGKRRHRRDTQTPPDLHYRVPHKKQHRAGGAW